MDSDGQHGLGKFHLIWCSRSSENLELLRVQCHETEIQAGECTRQAEEKSNADCLDRNGQNRRLRIDFHEINALDAAVSSVLEDYL